MKYTTLATVPMIFCMMAILGGNTQAENTYRGSLVEIPIDGFISPSQGFEDKNIVEGVVYGYLPNSCYTLNKSEITFSPDNPKKMIFKQFAFKKADGVCAENNSDGEGLAEHLKMRIPFSSEVFIGLLPIGSYKIEYQRDGGQGLRTLEVTKGTTAGDNFPYANVLNAMVTEVAYSNEEVNVSLSGVFNSTCTTLDRVEQKKMNDVIVLFPILKATPGKVCLQVLVPFQTSVNLGKISLGTHLIHIRSMNGKAVNRLVQVIQ
ncbi:MAG: hypothetical protein ABIQ95_07545 [Bdellovibrionia bacterium]